MNLFTKAFSLLLVSILESCATSFNYQLKTIDSRYSNEKSRQYSNFKEPSNLDQLVDLGNEIIELIKGDTYNRTRYVNLANSFFGSFVGVIDTIYIRRTEYYANGTDSYKQKFQDIYSLYLELSELRYKILEESYHSEYRSALFGDMSDEDIEAILNRTYTDEEISEINRHFEDIANQAEELYNTSSSSSTYVDSMYNLFVEFKDVTLQFQNKTGVQDYLAYKYSNGYSRDYTPEEIRPFYTAVKEKLVPAIDSYSMPSKDDFNDGERTYINFFNSANFRYSQLNLIPAIETYVKQLQPLNRSYNHLWSNGYYCFSDSVSSLGSAFTIGLNEPNEPLLYFSRNYQDCLTFIHEFGHYVDSYYNEDSSSVPMDISEIHSQGNELLFASYLEDNNPTNLSDRVLEYIVRDKVKDQATTVFAGAYVAEVEDYLLHNDISNKSETIAAIKNINQYYKDYINEKYCWAPMLSSSGYYISYATSSIGALELYVNSKEDYQNALSQYETILVGRDGELSIKGIIEKAGLKPIYSAETVEYIADYLKNWKIV